MRTYGRGIKGSILARLRDLLGGLFPLQLKKNTVHFGFSRIPYSPPKPAFELLSDEEEAGLSCGVMSRLPLYHACVAGEGPVRCFPI